MPAPPRWTFGGASELWPVSMVSLLMLLGASACATAGPGTRPSIPTAARARAVILTLAFIMVLLVDRRACRSTLVHAALIAGRAEKFLPSVETGNQRRRRR